MHQAGSFKIERLVWKGLIDSLIIFLTAIWLPHGQLWSILKGTASPTWCYSLRFNYFDPEITVSLVVRLSP